MNEQHANMKISDEGTIREYYETRDHIDRLTDDVKYVMMHPNYCLPYFQPGRFIQIKHKNLDFGWGVLVNYKERKQFKKPEEIPDNQRYIVDVLLNVSDGTSVGTKTYEDLPSGVYPPKDGEKGKMEVVPVMLSCVNAISHIRVHLPKDLKSADSRSSVKKVIGEVQRRFPDGVALIDPLEDMQIKDESLKKNLRVRCILLLCAT